jgi:myo-inositol-1(or 4)-monophosphatase
MTVATGRDLVAIATRAARRAGALAKTALHSRVATREKTGFHDLVTDVDHAAETVIVDEILRHAPGSTIVAEESGSSGTGALCWYVDPIDGTNNFARGVPFFCVSIGVALGDTLLAGVIYDPVRDELFTASEDGAFLNGEPIRSSGVATDRAALLVTDFPHPRQALGRADYDLYADLIAAFGAVRRLGSCALGLAYVASGRVDATVATNAKAWDGAAGALLVSAAGGQFVGRSTPAWHGPVLVAACAEFELDRSRLGAFLRDPSA